MNRKKYYKQYNRNYYLKNKKVLSKKHIKYYIQNKNTIKLVSRKYKLRNRIKISNYQKQYSKYYRLNNRKQLNNYRYNKIHSDINFKLGCRLRTRLNMAIINNYKSGSAVKDLGCSISDFKNYIETKFLPEMSWKNYGRDGWHIDHIIPVSSFDLSNRLEFVKAVHFTNLQPMWAKDNILKSNKTID